MRLRPSIRSGTEADATRIGQIHVAAWQRAYRGLMPDSYLDGLSIDDRAASFRPDLTAPPVGHDLLVAEVEGHLLGFAVVGPERRGDASAGAGELFALNVDPASWRMGVGSALLRAARGRLSEFGHSKAVLWTGPWNAPALELYDSDGWNADGADRTIELFGVIIDEIRLRRSLTESPTADASTSVSEAVTGPCS